MFLSEKIPDREKIISLLSGEAKVHMAAFSAAVIGAELFLLANAGAEDFPRGMFALAFAGFFFFFAVLSNVVGLAAGMRAAEAAALIPAALFIWLLRDAEAGPLLSAAILAAAGMRAVFIFLPHREKALIALTFVLDAAALYLCLGEHVLDGSFLTDKLLFAALAVMTMAALQKLLCERGGREFPFCFFAIVGLLVVSLPMGREPIDWTPVIRAGERVVDRVMDAADDAAYYFSSFFEGDSYETGYSTLGPAGESTEGSGKTEIILRASEAPYHVYRDEENGKGMRVRRILYLTGGRGAEGAQLVRFLHFLYACGADRETAELFSRALTVDVTYEYLDTADEIAPENAFYLASDRDPIRSGRSARRHKKGYTLTARYIDVDYGSPYLTELLAENENLPEKTLSYEEISAYAKELYSIQFSNVMDEEEYEAACHTRLSEEELLTEGASERMAALAETITEGAATEYERCRQIEAYLRQYPYSRKAAGGHNPKSDMSSDAGMADIADRFLFETQTGYCVHYTSAMVMLLRLSGIPARASFGYRYVFPFEKEEAYEVDGGCAHTWPEAYLAGIGWVPFEPTAGVLMPAAYTWRRTAGGETSAGPMPEKPAVPELPEAEEPALEEEPGGGFPGAIGTVLLAMLLLLFGVIAGVFLAGRIRYRLASPEERFMMDVRVIRRSIRRQSGEAFFERGLMSDYLVRAPEGFREELRGVIEVYYRLIYGNEPAGVTPSESEHARSLRERLVRGDGSPSEG